MEIGKLADFASDSALARDNLAAVLGSHACTEPNRAGSFNIA
jgi:hypothetical protein